MRKTLAVALLAVLVAAACSDTPTGGDRSRLAETPGGKQGGGKAQGGKGSGAKKGSQKPGGGNLPGEVGGGAGAVGGAVEGELDVPGVDEEQQYPSAYAEVVEAQADGKSQGITPGYAEMMSASVEGGGDQFRITMTFDGEVPQQMPNDKTIMVVGFQVLRSEDEGYAFAGQATDAGWRPYAGGKNRTAKSKFPGEFVVEGNQIVMTVPWSFTRGAYPFKWIATSNWFQSLANTTHYKFDLLPNKDQANYPG